MNRVYDNGVYVHRRTNKRCWCGRVLWETTFMGEPNGFRHRWSDAEIKKAKKALGKAGAWTGIPNWANACPQQEEVASG